MAKRDDKHNMAEDYLHQVEWDSEHPLDRRGRPSLKHQPNWKYNKVFPKTSKASLFSWIFLIVISVLGLGSLFYAISTSYQGMGIFVGIIVLAVSIGFYFFTRDPRS